MLMSVMDFASAEEKVAADVDVAAAAAAAVVAAVAVAVMAVAVNDAGDVHLLAKVQSSQLMSYAKGHWVKVAKKRKDHLLYQVARRNWALEMLGRLRVPLNTPSLPAPCGFCRRSLSPGRASPTWTRRSWTPRRKRRSGWSP